MCFPCCWTEYSVTIWNCSWLLWKLKQGKKGKNKLQCIVYYSTHCTQYMKKTFGSKSISFGFSYPHIFPVLNSFCPFPAWFYNFRKACSSVYLQLICTFCKQLCLVHFASKFPHCFWMCSFVNFHQYKYFYAVLKYTYFACMFWLGKLYC